MFHARVLVVLAVLFIPTVLLASPTYVGSETCIDCHEEEAEAWRGSHHDLAWTRPDEGMVLGDFSGSEFTLNGVTSRFTTEDGAYFIESDGPDGASTKYPVKDVIGIAPLQQYALETAPGRLQSFDVPWDAVKEEWYHIYPDQGLQSGDALHWTGPYKTWNARCAECHATDYTRNYDAVTRTYSSTQAEIGVGCEACHGPGSSHVDWAQEASNAVSDGTGNTGLTVDYANGGQELLIQQCASCHSRREPFLSGSPEPGTAFHDAYRLSTLRPGLYHPDGQILDEVYVYGSFLQSKMYAEGVTCKNCHDVHAADLEQTGNAVCTQCHSESGNGEFPTLQKALYDDPSHHFHEAGTEGAECKSCHMIERVYMGIDGRRDHSFRVPRPDLTVRTGSPNACNDCHNDRSPQWASRQVDRWYPQSEYRGTHFSDVFAQAQSGAPEVGTALRDLAAYNELPAIVRATALEMLQGYASPRLADELAHLLTDPEPLIRSTAAPLQRAAEPATAVERLAPLLSDDMRAVRISAVREMLGLPPNLLPEADRPAFSAAMGDLRTALQTKMDFPETHMQLGGMALATRNFPNAVSAFSEAARLDPQMVQAWSMIIRLNAALGETDAAKAALSEALAANPGDQFLLSLRAQLP
ncbi:multiheme c-type cytochrome [uncultured Shimia sp.]|uniref:multiheme c-type cytochrome n=1 Tax=uncultured Shimia sp. TaxID=573152 RepID=UPI002628CE57|nr:multiheme c-type cytochrome [uncultured Shimia sp.]